MAYPFRDQWLAFAFFIGCSIGTSSGFPIPLLILCSHIIHDLPEVVHTFIMKQFQRIGAAIFPALPVGGNSCIMIVKR